MGKGAASSPGIHKEENTVLQWMVVVNVVKWRRRGFGRFGPRYPAVGEAHIVDSVDSSALWWKVSHVAKRHPRGKFDYEREKGEGERGEGGRVEGREGGKEGGRRKKEELAFS